MNTTEQNIIHFEEFMLDWVYAYYQLAGCKMLPVYEENDWVLYDERGKSGTYEVRHDDYTIQKVTLEEPEEYGVDYKESPIPRILDTPKLLERYTWIVDVFIDWPHRTTPSPFIKGWETFKKINTSWENEKEHLSSDPYLAMYWLLHFGLNCDKRYDEIKTIIQQNQLTKQLKEIEWALDFFKTTDCFYNIKIGQSHWYSDAQKEKFKDLFLIRRAYLVFLTQSYGYAGGKNALDKWWLSIKLYPNIEESYIRRIRWLKNNLEKFNRWNDFITLYEKEGKPEIPLLSYIFACLPNGTKLSKYADETLQILWDNYELWKDNINRSFAQIIIYDIRKVAQNKKLLIQCAGKYYAGETIEEEYQEILREAGIETNTNSQEITDLIQDIKKIEKEFYQIEDKKNENQKDLEKIWHKLDMLFDKLSPEQLYVIADNLDTEIAVKRLFHYIFTHPLPNKEATLTHIFKTKQFSASDIKHIFYREFPNIIDLNNDNLRALVRKWLLMPDIEPSARAGATMFLMTHIKKNRILDSIIEDVADYGYERAGLAKAVFQNLFIESHDVKYNAGKSLSDEQIEMVFKRLLEYINKNYDSDFEGVSAALDTISHLDRPILKPIVKNLLKNPRLKKEFGKVML